MSKSTFKILFYLRKNYLNKEGKAGIMIRLSLNGKNPTDDSKLVLTINRQPIGEWFKEQWKKFQQGLQQLAKEPRKSKGFRL